MRKLYDKKQEDYEGFEKANLGFQGKDFNSCFYWNVYDFVLPALSAADFRRGGLSE
ncbi:MAG: hypothetical protein RHS_0164 [Robinsoniella sp. RHS]|nr:MAG: hypothetical protein RHS_0164 [Robinsoniella sp. RHS]